MTLRIRFKTLLPLVSPLLLAVVFAYVQWGAMGLPTLPVYPTLTPETAPEPFGFPAWLRITHYVSFLFMVLLIRSGLQVLMDHPRLVVISGFTRNMNHIVMGTDDSRPIGLVLGLAGIASVAALNALANWAAWRHPRAVQHVAKAIVAPVMVLLLDHAAPVAEFSREDISPFFWPNGKVPTSDEWKMLAAGDFRDYRLKVYGGIENPVELSLDDLRALGEKTQITLHHCIQGWSGIAAWGGLPLTDLVRLVCPKPGVKAVVFYSYGEGAEGGQYYDSLSLENALHPHSLLAYDMNDLPLTSLHGAPLRLRVENQLGFKMVKWIQSIEFVENVESINQGEGGYNEDHEYFGELADI